MRSTHGHVSESVRSKSIVRNRLRSPVHTIAYNTLCPCCCFKTDKRGDCQSERLNFRSVLMLITVEYVYRPHANTCIINPKLRLDVEKQIQFQYGRGYFIASKSGRTNRIFGCRCTHFSRLANSVGIIRKSLETKSDGVFLEFFAITFSRSTYMWLTRFVEWRTTIRVIRTKYATTRVTDAFAKFEQEGHFQRSKYQSLLYIRIEHAAGFPTSTVDRVVPKTTYIRFLLIHKKTRNHRGWQFSMLHTRTYRGRLERGE